MGRKRSGSILPNGSLAGNRIGRQEDSSIANPCGNGNIQRIYRLFDPPSSGISGGIYSGRPWISSDSMEARSQTA